MKESIKQGAYMQSTSSELSFLDIIQSKEELLTRKQAAHYLGISAGTLAIWASVKRYNLPYIKIGHLVKYRRKDLDTFIASRTIQQKEI
jgi:excisionase family DNA binding protein